MRAKARETVVARPTAARAYLARGCLHQRRAREEDGALVAHNDGLVRHRRDVSPTRSAGSHHRRNLSKGGRGGGEREREKEVG